MDREGFRNRLNQYKKAREENPGLKYWEWKSIPKYDEGTNSVGVLTEEEMLRSKKKNLTDYRSEDFPPMIRFFGEEDHIKNVIRKRVNDPNAFSEKRFSDISDKYYTPFLKDKKIVLTDSENLTGATLSENLLDSIYKYSKIVGIPLQDAVGLAAQESTFGKYEGWMDPTSKMSVLAATGDVTQGFDPIKNLHNHTFVDDFYYSPANEARNWFYRKSPNEHRDTLSVRAAKELETNPNYYIQEGVKRYRSVENPWIHAFEQYKHGKYNTNDKRHTSDVQHAGKLVLEDPAVQKWAKEKGIAFAEGGEVGDNDFMKQFGKQVSYKPEETSWWSNVKNWWNDLTGMKNYAYGNCATTPNGKHTKECAHYSNSILRKQGYKNIVGDAWTRAANSGMKKITSGYDGLTKPAEWDESDAHDYLQSAANNFINNVDTTALNPYDVIGLYYPDSPNTKKAFEQGKWGETQTHTGHIAVGNDGTHYVVHNVGGHLKMNKLADMLTGDYDYLPVSAYRPKK